MLPMAGIAHQPNATLRDLFTSWFRILEQISSQRETRLNQDLCRNHNLALIKRSCWNTILIPMFKWKIEKSGEEPKRPFSYRPFSPGPSDFSRVISPSGNSGVIHLPWEKLRTLVLTDERPEWKLYHIVVPTGDNCTCIQCTLLVLLMHKKERVIVYCTTRIRYTSTPKRLQGHC